MKILKRFQNFKMTRVHRIMMVVSIVAVLAVTGTVIVVNSERIRSNFNPKAMEEQDKKDNDVAYDSSVFSTDPGKDQNLEMDEKAEDEKKLNEGQQNIKDEEHNRQSLALSDGSSNGGTGTGANVTNDGTGPVIGGNLDGSDNNIGGNGTSQGTGNNGQTPDTPDAPVIVPDKNEDEKYGTDYTSKEEIDSKYNSEEEDQNPGAGKQPITATRLEVKAKDTLMRHFYQGEAPRAGDMLKYITVTAYMSDGTTRENLLYKPSDEFGGDYLVSWGGNPENTVTNSAGYPIVGGLDDSWELTETGTYDAVISYRGQTLTLPYDIVHWTVTLQDFAEDTNRYEEDLSVAEYEKFPKELSPTGVLGFDEDFHLILDVTPVIDFMNHMQNMYNLIGARTESMKNDGYVYAHTNVEADDSYDLYGNKCCVQYFGGWADDNNTEGSGEIYKIKRPEDEEVTEGEYNVDLMPTWTDVSQIRDYKIGLYGAVGSDWSTKLTAYTGKSSRLVVPQGVNVVEVSMLQQSEPGYDYETNPNPQNEAVTEIVFPSSLNAYENQWWEDYINYFPNLEKYEVAADNQSFLSEDGVLYDKLGKTLLSVPPAMKKIDTWSPRVQAINMDAFQYAKMEKLRIPASVKQCNVYSFFNAEIGKLDFGSTDALSLGVASFDNILSDKPLIKEITLRAEKIVCDDVFMNLNFNETDLANSGIRFVVDDQDTGSGELYRSTLWSLQRGIDSSIYPLDTENSTAYSLLKRTGKAGEYSYSKGMLLTDEGKTLYGVSPLVPGELEIPQQIETIASGAFASAEAVTAFKMYGAPPKTWETWLFGDSLPQGLKIYVSDEYYNQYIDSAGRVLDKNYGEGTAAKLFQGVRDLKDAVIQGGNIYYKNEDGTYRLSHVEENTQGFFTPMEGTSILSEGCFANCEQLLGVVLPDTLKTLEGNVFAGCTSLKVLISNAEAAPDTDVAAFSGMAKEQVQLYLPEAKTEEGTSAVWEEYQREGWTGFASVSQMEAAYAGYSEDGSSGAVYGILADGSYKLLKGMVESEYTTLFLMSNTTEIAEDAFRGNENLFGISNAGDVSKIGAHAFEGCINLAGIDLNDGYMEITAEAAAFKNCSSLTSLTSSYGANGGWTFIPNRMTSIPEECFYGCTSLDIVAFRDGFSELGKGSFEKCSGLTAVLSRDPDNYIQYFYSLPMDITTVPESCFEDCTKLELAAIPEKVTSIGRRAFYGCTTLSMDNIYEDGVTRYVIPESVTSIGEQSFANCTGFSQIIVSGTLTSLGAQSFAGDVNLAAVEFEKLPQNISEDMLSDVNELRHLYFEGCPLINLRMGEHLLIGAESLPEMQTYTQPEPQESKEDESAVKEPQVSEEEESTVKEPQAPENTETEQGEEGQEDDH